MEELNLRDIRTFIQNASNENEARTFQGIAPIYPFTNEHLAGYFPFLNLEGKSVLTVSGSGDQVLNAVYYGAQRVDAFDINLLSALYTELKMRALCALTYEEYLAFFSLDRNDPVVLSWPEYAQFAQTLSPATKSVFDLVYQTFQTQGWAVRNSHLFYNQPAVDHKATVYNAYLQNARHYLQTRSALGKVAYQWCQSDVTNLCSCLEPSTRYDVILLSNIADYAHHIYPGPDYLRKFTQRILRPLTGHLASDGLVCVACLFQIDDEASNQAKNDLYHARTRRDILDSLGLEYVEEVFPSAISGHQDALIALRKPANDPV